MEPWMVVSLLGAAVLVFARLYGKASQDGDDRASAEVLLKEMEGSLEAYALEVGQENKELLQHVHALKEEQEKRFAALQARIERLEKDAIAAVRHERIVAEPVKQAGPALETRHMVQPEMDAGHQMKVVEPPSADPRVAGIGLQDRYQQIFEYDKQGKSIDWIARKTGIIKGEVQLILKLAQQEESGSV